MAERSKAEEQLNDYKKSRAVRRLNSVFVLKLSAILSNVAFLHILCFWPSNLQGLGYGYGYG